MRRKTAVIMITALLAVGMSACTGKADKASADRDGKEAVLDTEQELADDTEAVTDTGQNISGKQDADDAAVADAEAGRQENDNSDSKNTGSSSGSSAGNSSATGSGSASGNTTGGNVPSNSGTADSGSNTGTSSQGHTHNWVTHNAVGHYETQTVKEAWDEPVYEMMEITRCSECKIDITNWSIEDITAHMFAHMDVGENGGYYSTGEYVQTGTIHHEAVTEEVWVEEAYGYTECSICGERTININHNH